MHVPGVRLSHDCRSRPGHAPTADIGILPEIGRSPARRQGLESGAASRSAHAPIADAQPLPHSRTLKMFKPRKSMWLILAVICPPIASLGAVDLVSNPTQWPYGMARIAGVTVLVGYNLTARLVIDDEFVAFKRYGPVVWRTPTRGALAEDVLAGDLTAGPAKSANRRSRRASPITRLLPFGQSIGVVADTGRR